MNGRIEELKLGLLKCANENEDKTYLTGQVIISSICKDAKNTIDKLEKENEQLKQQLCKKEREFKYFSNSFKLKIQKLKDEIEIMKGERE
jgi:adenine-specific DNA methylase